MDTRMNFLSGPGMAGFKVFQDINLSRSPGGILEPAVPEAVVGKPILPGAGSEGFIPGLGPGEFVLDRGHRSGSLFTEIVSRQVFLIILFLWRKISSSSRTFFEAMD